MHLLGTRSTLLGGWGWGEADGRRSMDGGSRGRGYGTPLHSSEEEAWGQGMKAEGGTPEHRDEQSMDA